MLKEEGGGAVWSEGLAVTDGDAGDGGKGGGLRSASIISRLPNSPSSELSGADVTQPNCSALEQHIIFTLIVEKQRWRLFRDAAGLDAGSCTRTLT